jgi:hypothetical protein
MAELVSLHQAKDHLRIKESHEDGDIELKLNIATAMVLDRVSQRRSGGEDWAAEIALWGAEGSPSLPVPPQIQAAILYQIGELWRFRGDDLDTPKRAPNTLHPFVEALLARFCDPTLS